VLKKGGLLAMNKTLKQAIPSRWLLVLNEYELIKQKKSKNFKTVTQLCQTFKVHRKDIRKYYERGLKLGKIPRLYCLKREAQNLASLKY